MKWASLHSLSKHSPDVVAWASQRTSGSAYYSSIDFERMKGWVGLVGWPCSGWFTHKWSPVSYRSGEGQGKLACQWPAFYHCATQPTVQCVLFIWGQVGSRSTVRPCDDARLTFMNLTFGHKSTGSGFALAWLSCLPSASVSSVYLVLYVEKNFWLHRLLYLLVCWACGIGPWPGRLSSFSAITLLVGSSVYSLYSSPQSAPSLIWPTAS